MSDDLRYHILRSGCNIPNVPGELAVHTSRLILVALADHANRDGKVFVSTRTLATELDMADATVFIAYRLYEKEGILIRTGKRMGKGGAIEYQMKVNHLEPRNLRFVSLSIVEVPGPTSASELSNKFGRKKPDTLASPSHSSDNETASLAVSGTDMTIQDRSESGSESGNLNSNLNESSNTRLADVKALFYASLDLELEYRPSNVPRDVLVSMKRKQYSRAAERVLDAYPRAKPSTYPDRDLALAVCEMMNPDDFRFSIGPTTRRTLNDRYR
jgi:hypothetical protein